MYEIQLTVLDEKDRISVKYISNSISKGEKIPMKFRKTLAVLLLALCLFQSIAMAAGNERMPALAYQVVQQVNAERAKYGLAPLRMDATLNAAAAIRGEEITRKFSHTRPDGSKWSTVSKKAYGENIARGQKTVDKVMAAWLTSEGHRRNILRESFGSIGVSCVKSGSIYYWVQLFGR